MKSTLFLFGISVLLFGSLYSFAFAQPAIPTGRAINILEILTIANSLVNYLYTVGIIIVGIVLVWAGIVYTTAGGDSAKVKTAKGLLIGAIIGALVIFGAGAIISTLSKLASDPGGFFSGGGAGNNSLPNGSVCTSGNDCQSAYCNLNLNPGICQ